MSGGLRSDFADAGYVVVRGLLDPSEVSETVGLIPKLIGANREILGLPETDDPAALLERVLCVHHVHKISDRVLAMTRSPRLLEILVELVGENLKLVQSELFIKPPGFPGNPWHQDESIMATRDKSLVAAWIALEDVDAANGCLRVVPSSHADGYLYPRREHGNPQDYDFPLESYGFDLSQSVDVELNAGDAIFFHGYLLHGSGRNRSERFRRAFTFHYMNSYALLPWFGGQGDVRDVVQVHGWDPYAWKGYSDQNVPHLRRWPSGVGREFSARSLPATVRDQVTKALTLWSYDEVAAVEALRAALKEYADGE